MSQAQKDENEIKLAVEYADKNPFLGVYNKQEPLIAFIRTLMKYWGLENAENYALRFTDVAASQCHFVTENNRGLIKLGFVLQLDHSPAKRANSIIECFKKSNDSNDIIRHSQDLRKFSCDYTFAEEFINRQGLQLLIELVERRKFDGLVLSNILQSFQDLMDQGIVPWDSIEPTFIQAVAYHINAKAVDSQVLQMCMYILESIVRKSQNLYQIVEKEITLPNLLARISNYNSSNTKQQERRVGINSEHFGTQKAVLALINALFRRAESARKRYIASTISDKRYRYTINHNILQNLDQDGKLLIDDEMSHQLYVLQQLLLNQYEGRMRTSLDPNDTETTEKIKELRKVAFENDVDVEGKDVTTRRMEIKKEYKKLGFKDDINPAQDFKETPPGMLALDNMSFFAREHSEKYSKLVLENYCRDDSHECPFGRASIELTRLLCEILHIGDPPSDDGLTFYPMLFSHDHAFEELFCICIVLLNKTWKDMKATTEDFVKVLNVVKEQITRTIQMKLPTFDKFYEEINKLTYAKIADIWLADRLHQEEREMQAPPIQELRAQIEPEILELVQQHRLNYLVQGSGFKHKSKGREKYWYCRLSPNYKFFHYGDCEEKATPSIEELKEKVGVVDIKGLITGKDCQHATKRVKNAQVFPFSLLLESINVSENKSLDFITQDETVFNYWTDGINALLCQRMVSPAAETDVKSLLDMEIKLRLLDAEGVSIPHHPPPIPPPPPNYNFCYQQN